MFLLVSGASRRGEIDSMMYRRRNHYGDVMTIQRFSVLCYRPGITRFAIAIFLTWMMAGPAAAQYIYPQKGQDQAQQDKDRGECHVWAANQSGFDPTRASTSAPPSKEAQQGGVLRGGARGALGGAVVGAIAGDAGKGAKIGAAGGGLVGGMRRSDQKSRQKQEQQNWQAQQNALRNEYERARMACLEGRGYTVR
jgi:hypothetical protein